MNRKNFFGCMTHFIPHQSLQMYDCIYEFLIPFAEFSSSSNRQRTADADVFTQAVNLAGLPAVSVPVALTEGEEGMPIGLQLIGQPFHEESILKVAKWIENYAQFPHLPALNFARDS